MRKVRSVLRLHFEAQLSQHQIARSLGLSSGVVNKYIQPAIAAGLSWPLPEAYQEEQTLIQCLRPEVQPKPIAVRGKGIDWGWIHQEMKRKGVTLQLLWEEYQAGVSSPLSYSHFCFCYRRCCKKQPVSMRQTHRAGEKVFVDYAGQTVAVKDLATGEIRLAQIFLAVLGASNYCYAEATWS